MRKSKLMTKQYLYCSNMDKVIEDAIGVYDICIRAKVRKKQPSEVMGQTSTAIGEQFQVFFTDIIGPKFKIHANDSKYILTLIDACTKIHKAYPLRDITAEKVINISIKEFFPRVFTSIKLVTGRGSQFISRLMKQVGEELGVMKIETEAYQPHTNPVKRLHQDLEQLNVFC
uniref:Putative LOC101163468 [Oryzias latipes] n=1 Tax=Lepeophtheirus salmonis TaxID=72036 RepID=A0A0K2TIX2_LEPSM